MKPEQRLESLISKLAAGDRLDNASGDENYGRDEIVAAIRRTGVTPPAGMIAWLRHQINESEKFSEADIEYFMLEKTSFEEIDDEDGDTYDVDEEDDDF